MAEKRRKHRKKRRRKIGKGMVFLLVLLLTGTVLFMEQNHRTSLPESSDGWELMLVNQDHPLASSYVPSLLTLDNGEQVDERIYPALQHMFDDARSQGIELYVRSGYRSFEDQKALYDSTVQSYLDQGMSEEEAEAETEQYTAAPGTSEHQTGLAVDINTVNDNITSDTALWLEANAPSYGFVKRYADDKADITGINNEPWHYRYVGTEAAQYMTEHNLCLEEYVS
jgi:D-alanyl-D-alanine carboxypeptidase